MDHLQIVVGVEVSSVTFLVALGFVVVVLCMRCNAVSRKLEGERGRASLRRSQRVTASFSSAQGSGAVSIETCPLAGPVVGVEYQFPLAVSGVRRNPELSDPRELHSSMSDSHSNASQFLRQRVTNSKQKYYAVRQGRCPGIYHTWADCKSQVDGFRGSRFKSFRILSEAEGFMVGRF
jgi:hypothetical protein